MKLSEPTSTLLISDLHLMPEREDITQTLVKFLRDSAHAAQQLFILGDLFEVWIGDDAPNPLADLVAQELNNLSKKGTAVFLMHGNRDFLIGEQFSSCCGGTLIEEPYLLEAGNQRIALMHGDSLCLDDMEYMKFRTMVRNPDWQQAFLALPLSERYEIAREARMVSQQHTKNEAPEIMDVNQSEVVRVIEELGINTLIHGHTHRPATHSVSVNEVDQTATRIVLGDWDKQAWFIEITQDQIELHNFPLVAG